jgi:hypothetical protein
MMIMAKMPDLQPCRLHTFRILGHNGLTTPLSERKFAAGSDFPLTLLG